MQHTPLPASLSASSMQQHASKRISSHDRREAATSGSVLSYASHLPASLGVGAQQAPARSLKERLGLSRNASSSSSASSLPRSQSSVGGLQFSNASASSFSTYIPTWAPQSQSSNPASHPPDRLSASSSTASIDLPSASIPSRNFLVPIGTTGARQKLSISSASQRRKLARSEDATWSTLSPQSQMPAGASGLNRSQSDLHNLSALDGSAVHGLSRSSSSGLLGSSSGSSSPLTPQSASHTVLTPAELVQQAAMQRLSSQRFMAPHQPRSVSENIVPARSSSNRPSLGPPASAQPIVEQQQSSSHLVPTSSTSDRRPEPLPMSSTPLAPRSAAVVVPDRTASSSIPNSDADRRPAPAIVNASVQPPADSRDLADDNSISSRPLTLAETYKRAMLERDAERARSAAARIDIAPSKVASAPSQASAPTLDLKLPSSSFFDDDDSTRTSTSTVTPQPPTSPATVRHRESDVSTTQHRLDGRTRGLREAPTPPRDDVNSSRIATLDKTTPPRSGSALPSLQKSYDEAMSIQSRIKSRSNDEPAYGGLFDSNIDPFATSATDDQLARSYLALRDEDEDAAERHGKATPKQNTTTPSASKKQAEQATKSSPLRSPAPDVGTPRTPPADKSFVQFSTPEEDRTTPKAELTSYDVTSPRRASQAVAHVEESAFTAETERPALLREVSLKTLRSPPNKLEASPGPHEEAALQAGAVAAAAVSPSVNAGTSPMASKPPSRTSPAVNGERTLHPIDETADAARWRRGQEALATFSPLQQSRFSEASTDRSDSRAPTRNERRYSGRASSVSSADGLGDDSNDGHLLPASAWHEVENALRRFRDKTSGVAADRGNLLRAVLLPFLALEAETITVDVVGSGIYVKGKARRALFFDWIRSLLLELQHVQTSADRGAILESIACIIESRNFSASILSADPEDEARFSSVFGHILSYAIGELNKKGVYQNTLIFSGRLLAVAFFRVNGVASKLLRALPVNRFALERVAREFEWQRKRPVDFDRFANRFPATLRQLCYKDSRQYLKMLDSESVAGSANGSDPQSAEDDRFLVCQPEVEVEMSGNWLRRWQSDDSELFFSFCRSYHRQLASLFASSKTLDSVSKYFFGGPGYAHLATCVHQKCLALVHRVILSVTTLSSQKNFNPAGETANVLSGSTAGKPRILEAANRRCTAIVVDIVRAPAGSNMIFAPMLGLHIKALIKRTSLYDVQGVFCLLDWLDGVISHMDTNEFISEGFIDVSFIITTIGMLLENADHALALMRTIAFCYANFGVLTATSENRVYFCEQILLKPSVFHKLFLSWSFTIRAYYLHLLVFRLARISDFPSPSDDPSGRTAVRVVRLFNQRLETLRKRHDVLSPETDSSSDGTKSEDGRSRKSGTSTFVSTIKRASTDGEASSEGSNDGRPRAEKIMGMTAVDPRASPSTKSSESKKASHSKTKSWLKAFRGAKDGKNGSHRAIQPFSPTSGRATSGVESDDDSKTIGSARTTPRTSFESASSDTLSDVSTLAGSVRGGKSKSGSGFEFDIKEQQKQQQQQQGARSSSQATHSPTHDAGVAADTMFDLQSGHAQQPPTPGRTPMSPRISKAFSRRASMLPGPASELVAEAEAQQVPPVPDLPTEHMGLGLSGVNGGGPDAPRAAEVYDDTLHIYAVQSLREYEQTVQEHDEFFASVPRDQSTQVPRLPVNWPAMWSSTGE
ncbi:hypothetical protein PHSY_002552 [Pseudozyma hubeiensis SY62]|uniref:Uncharacterized protein n=1 Tax=Pseudozyma hubeiensis (strain SY62) TaxID=1305764 RepID=R9P1D6_PSEHS|nr:hypothetical protein PHSY_002552 [Pseudozyma hubeiensis SY62]GAC94979.1 hypothetical protein PHSY_002552 [Pseudozyma hubeiensis SY62]